MINKRLIAVMPTAKKYIIANIFFQIISLCANIFFMISVSGLIAKLFSGAAFFESAKALGLKALLDLVIRFVCVVAATKMAYLSSKEVKKKLREMIFGKLLKLGSSYKDKAATSELVQLSVEGVEQIESYFSQYLPQFFYAMLAPVILFVVLSRVNIVIALALLLCVPLIPISIMFVQKWAKKLLSKYWGKYVALGDSFLENLQGLTTLKVYKADAFKHKQMNEQAESFRKITMRVLIMQLNSISIMDLVAFGGAALGIILSVIYFKNGSIDLFGALLVILLSAEFFIPMRLLGSFFHIAMNGMAASDKIFKLLDAENNNEGCASLEGNIDISVENLSFSYDEHRETLKDISMRFPSGSFSAIIGESGCGKSTLASILMGKTKLYSGKLSFSGFDAKELSEKSIMDNFCYVPNNSYLFTGTVRENLLMANKDASDEEMISALKRVKIYDFLSGEKGLDTFIRERASNLSGGQRQRLALARALLKNSKVYIFDEASSNIDVESENDIMAIINELSKEKTIILISHRLANAVRAENIYCIDDGKLVESGSHEELLKLNGHYHKLWQAQCDLENYRGDI